MLNPAGASGQAGRKWARVLAALGPLETRETRGPGDATRLAREAVEEGFERVAAVGGDGTIREVASALVGTDAVLGVVPAGTANDLARTMGTPRDLVAATAVALQGPARTIDAAETDSGERFVNIAGAGFDAAVSVTIDRQRAARRLSPQLRYYLAILSTFVRYRATDLVVTVNGERREAPGCLLAAVGVMRFYGGGLMMLPRADPADGLLDVCWGQGIRLAELVSFMSLLRKGGHLEHPKVRYAQAREVAIEAASETPFHLDGDVCGRLPFSARVLPGALRVAVPET